MKKGDVLKKQDIVIHVEPNMAISAIGMLRGYLPSIIDSFEASLKESGVTFKESYRGDVEAVLDEIYEKCIARTEIRETTNEFMDLLGIADGEVNS
jgi:hypothetical protein